ncbi:MAG: major facilitator superfamily 1, partial [Solirubrobacterales bacterium]|nr:major facilitator superfamily 1 [Solirubrobacterales bacterium]
LSVAMSEDCRPRDGGEPGEAQRNEERPSHNVAHAAHRTRAAISACAFHGGCCAKATSGSIGCWEVRSGLAGSGRGWVTVGPRRHTGECVLRSYLLLLRTPAALPVVAASLVGRLSIALLEVPLIVLAQGATGSYAGAGLAAAAWPVGIEVTAPTRGRVIDRYGAPVLDCSPGRRVAARRRGGRSAGSRK